jgi:threonine dehydratase
MEEIDEERNGNPATHIVVPIGVGSLGQAVTTHSKSAHGSRKTVIAVEPDNAACLWNSLEAGKPTSVETGSTIMSGMNCGTLSSNVWKCLSSGVDASVTVSDFEAHEAVQYLNSQGLSAGPCGAAALAAVRYIAQVDRNAVNLTSNSVVVLLCTEGTREYAIPSSKSGDGPVRLN